MGRMVTRLPPLLSYDLDAEIIPKMLYLEGILGLTVYDVMKFPAYFSYSLVRRIEPRTRFVQATGGSVTRMGLNMVLTLTDKEFCKRVANAPLDRYIEFREAFFQIVENWLRAQRKEETQP